MAKKRNAASAGTRVIRTKLGPPRQARRVVRRDELLQTLSLSSERVLTVLRAPAGFGKTTLLTDWREQLLVQQRIVAWLTLDADDNDASQFVVYLSRALVDALDTLADEMPELRGDAEPTSPKVVLTSLINALSGLAQPITLILDDYDRIVSGAIHELLSFLILHAPENLHLVLATRSEPPLPLAYLRAHDELVEIDASGLRFGFEHTRSFLAEVATLKLSADQMRTLHETTEGWVAGLQIAAIGLRGRDDADALIGSFSGNFRAVNDYLAQAVLPNLDESTVEFLLRTSILERLSGPLCDFVAGSSGGQQTLEYLLGQNLFVQALDDESRWFRHHALFADFLRGQLGRRFGEQLPALHLRAAQWFAEHELWSEAVRHALAADRPELATEWVERCAMREIEDSHVRRLLGWTRKLPIQAVRQRPRLRMALAWALLLTIQLDEALALVDEVGADLAAADTPPPADIEAELLALRFCIIALKDDTAAAMPLGEKFLAALPQLSGDGHAWFVQASLNGLTHCYQKAGQVERARAMQEPSLYPVSDAHSRKLFTRSYRACTLGACDVREGRLQEGEQRFRDALQFAEAHAGRRSAAATLVACSLAGVLYERDQLDEVEQLLADRLDIIDDACYLDSVRTAYQAMVRTAIARGDFAAAHGLLDRAEGLGARRRWARLTAVCLAERLRLLLLEGRHADAERVLQLLKERVDESRPLQCCAASEAWRLREMAQARWHLHEGRAAEAVALLRAVLVDEEPGNNRYPVVRTRMLLALALEQDGRHDEARDLAALLAREAQASGLVRSLRDEGAAGDALLVRAMVMPADPERVPPRAAVPAQRLIDPLSERERDVLSLVARGMSNKQAAKALMLGTETVKWHLKNVYSKLGVSRRTSAVHRARQMRLIVEAPQEMGG